MKLKDLLLSIPYKIIQGTDNTEASDVIYDSRKIIEGCCFVCIKGYAVDGHKFAADAVEKGAASLIVTEDIDVPENITVIKVDDARVALSKMSAEFFSNPAKELITIGVTGTKGKTTTVAMIRSILETAGIKTGTIGTLGIIIDNKVYKTNNTTPESYEIHQTMRKMVKKGCSVLIMEVSSIGLKQHRTDNINFDYGIFTNFSHDHIGGNEHENMEEYLYCKSLLFKQCKTGIVNIDDPATEELLKNATCKTETYGYSQNADLIGSDDSLIARNGYVGVNFKATGKKNLNVDVAIPGRFSVYNALAAISVCSLMNITEENILKGLDTVKVKGRVEVVDVPGNYTLLIDYAHNAASMESVLTTLREYKPNRLVTMFGAGGNRPKARRFEMGEVSGKLSDLSVITEDNSRFESIHDIIADIKTGIDKTDGKYVIVPNRVDAIRYCIENAQDGDIIVLAGKGHEDYLEINGTKYHFDEREIIDDIIKSL
ncbi:MAG: UDP-N-acetylmuramoyl-L-alanyl-D-glutamate--2,6-diaminopimelate ligase [Ruminococcus sp.]|nr:UDP-N-acetylmuramoyl-L-alanyl-D-glutamate--2,6-diaminopimelate ligase [Ruminococcus sp.]